MTFDLSYESFSAVPSDLLHNRQSGMGGSVHLLYPGPSQTRHWHSGNWLSERCSALPVKSRWCLCLRLALFPVELTRWRTPTACRLWAAWPSLCPAWCPVQICHWISGSNWTTLDLPVASTSTLFWGYGDLCSHPVPIFERSKMCSNNSQDYSDVEFGIDLTVLFPHLWCHRAFSGRSCGSTRSVFRLRWPPLLKLDCLSSCRSIPPLIPLLPLR